MIRSLLLDVMTEGTLPVYDTGPSNVLVLHQGDWVVVHHQGHATIPLGIDTDLEEFEANLREWVGKAQAIREDGTLLFTYYAHTGNDDQHFGHTGLGGLAYYTPVLPVAFNLQDGDDPVNFILDWRRGATEHPRLRQMIDYTQGIRERYEQHLEEERRASEQANERARRLLLGCLTPEQREELVRARCFHVRGQDGNVYRIDEKSHQNVFRVEGMRAVMQYCVVSSDLPIYDLMLAQKLLLETNVQEFLRLANKWDLTQEHRHRVDLDLDLLRGLRCTVEELEQAERYVIEPTPVREA